MAGLQTLVAEPHTSYELTVADLDPLRAAICAVGEFDLAARDDLTEVLQHQTNAGRRFVRLDLSRVTFLDCSCLGVLVAFHHSFLKLHGLLILTGVNAHVARLLTLTGLNNTLFLGSDKDDPFGCLPPPATPVHPPAAPTTGGEQCAS